MTAADCELGDITGYAAVKLTESDAGNITGSTLAKVVDGVETRNLTGSVTITGSSAGDISNYKTVTLSDSSAADVSNVNKVTVSKGDNAITSFTGTEGDDTLTVNKGAVLRLGGADFGADVKGKDTLNVAGTLVLTGENFAGFEKLSGKGEIAADEKLFGTVSEIFKDFQGKVINLGATSVNFRGTASELADNTEKKAVKWDGSDFGGWLCAAGEVTDTVDYIKFTADEDDTLEITGLFADGEVSLNGEALTFTDGAVSVELAAGTSYTLKLEKKEGDSVSYSISLA